MFSSFLQSIKFSGYRMEMKIDKDPLVIEQNNYPIKILNAYIVYDLKDWSKNPLNNFKLKKLFTEQF